MKQRKTPVPPNPKPKTPSHKTLANPAIMITPSDADIAFTVPTIIVTRPDTTEWIELSPNSLDVLNPFIMKYTTDQMSSQNNTKMTMIEIF